MKAKKTMEMLFVGWIVMYLSSFGENIEVLHHFSVSDDGGNPCAGVIQGTDGALYGTTYIGGLYGGGTVFQLNSDGSFTVLHHFYAFDGRCPYAGVIQGADGVLYGTTVWGGATPGVVFKLNSDGSDFNVIHYFGRDDGYCSSPRGSVIQGTDGALYGTTYIGGLYSHGAVFQLNSDGSVTVLHSFSGDDGADPYAGLIQGTDGALYGTTSYDRLYGGGTVFQLNLDGSGFRVLHSFSWYDDGANPYAGLIQGTDGALYGTTSSGGQYYGGGTVFQLNSDGNFTVLHIFSGDDGANPYAGLIQGTDGALYGTTSSGGLYGGGTVFQLNLDGSGFRVLHSFSGDDGANPYAGLIQGTDGALYGTTYSGGSEGYGTVFRVRLFHNNTPVAVNDLAITWQNSPIVVAVLANDSDIDGDALSVGSIETAPLNGIASINADNTVTYTPTSGFVGSDSFTYTVSDGQGGVASAPVNIIVKQAISAMTRGTVVGWGANYARQASPPSGLNNVVAIAAGETYSLALKSDGTVVGWGGYGYSNYGMVSPPEGLNSVVAITAGYYHSLALKSDGTVVGWGGYGVYNFGMVVFPPEGLNSVVAIAAGYYHNLALKSDGMVVGWGNSGAATPPAGLNNVIAIAAGWKHSLALKSDGTVVGWGDNSYGQSTPTEGLNNVVAIAGGYKHSLALKSDGTVVGWGNSGAAIPPGGLNNVIAIAAGGFHSLALKSDGTVVGWGDGQNTPPAGLNNVVAIAGNLASLAIVAPQNHAPVAVDDTANTPEDTAIAVDVLANDGDVDGDSLNVLAVAQPANPNASVVNNQDGTVTYTPALNYNGVDSFTYTVSDGKGGTSVGNVTITVTPVNHVPAAANDSASTLEDTAIVIDVLANDTDGDGDSLSLMSVVPPAHGTVAISDGKAVYTPAANYNGADSFTYTVSDGNGGTAEATVNITITPVNDASVANSDSYSTPEDTVLTGSAPGVLGNDTDVDGDTLSAVLAAGPTHGTLTLNANGSFVYTPNANYNGSDSFTYKANDGKADSSVATVSITVNAVNDAPMAVNDSASTPEDTAIVIDVLANDTDVDGDALSLATVANPAHGTAAINAGKIVYTPALNYNGTDSFTYTVSDGNGGTAEATVNITVTPVNDAPVARIESPGNIQTMIAKLISFVGIGSDVDGDSLTYQWAFGDGATAQGATATHTYSGAGSFTVTLIVTDTSGGASQPASIQITVITSAQAINDLVAVVTAYNLKQGIANSLDTKLTNAMAAMNAANADQRGDAVNKMQAFINAVTAQRGKELTNEQADNLIAIANDIICSINLELGL